MIFGPQIDLIPYKHFGGSGGSSFSLGVSESSGKNSSGCPKCKTLQDYINYHLGLNGSKNEEELEKAIASGDEDSIDRANKNVLQNEANFEQAVRTAQETAKFIADYNPFGFANAYYQFTMGDSNFNKGLAVLAFLPVGKLAKFARFAKPNGKFYSVAYEMTVGNNLFPGGSYYQHFSAANRSLFANMSKSTMMNLGITFHKSKTGAILWGRSPKN
ncbi:hypothetical protein [Polaribacter porphyrae]|uniref:Uncharacterized protein n=1 Tax=Polaribacter porphyrae TaxID=1137780 RepID=A0A2S7WMD5_9FLAO|nr:hypothetical protein [Polaribacter porphyrae]PQJ78760.1 hypothetical protein BTO18_05980 [Polaribacter porphyrae]